MTWQVKVVLEGGQTFSFPCTEEEREMVLGRVREDGYCAINGMNGGITFPYRRLVAIEWMRA